MLHYSPKLFKRLWWEGKLAFHCFMDLREEWLIQQQTGNLQQGKGQTHTESHLAHLQGGGTRSPAPAPAAPGCACLPLG